MSVLDKTPKYYLEILSGAMLGIVTFIAAYSYCGSLSFISDNKFADKLLDISIALFGFLLVILTLIIQSPSEVIASMRSNGLYKKLIGFNKRVILLTAIVGVLSFTSMFLKEVFIYVNIETLTIIQCLNVGIFIWALVDTFIYIRIFYKIISTA